MNNIKVTLKGICFFIATFAMADIIKYTIRGKLFFFDFSSWNMLSGSIFILIVLIASYFTGKKIASNQIRL